MSKIFPSLNLQIGDIVIFHGNEEDLYIEAGMLAKVADIDGGNDLYVETEDYGWWVHPDGRIVAYEDRDNLYVTFHYRPVTGITTSPVGFHSGDQVRIVTSTVNDDYGVLIDGLIGTVQAGVRNQWKAPWYVEFIVSNGTMDGFYFNDDGQSPEWPGTYVVPFDDGVSVPVIDWKSINEATSKPAKASPQPVRKSVDQIMAEVDKRAAEYLARYMSKVPKIDPRECTIEYAHRAPDGTIIIPSPRQFRNVPIKVNDEMCEPVKRYVVITEWVTTDD